MTWKAPSKLLPFVVGGVVLGVGCGGGGTTPTPTPVPTPTPAPTVTKLNVSSGPVGTSVVITGSNFTAASFVTFGTVSTASFKVDSASQITVLVPTGATTGTVSVTTPNGTGSGPTFTVTTVAAPAPTVASLSVTSGVEGSTVVITGTNLTNASVVSFGGITAPAFHVDSATQITVAVPAGALTGAVKVTTPGGQVDGPTFTVTVATTSVPPPTVASISQASGVVGSTVVITGTNFANASAVVFGDTATLSFTVNSATQITVTVPAGATTGVVSVITPGGNASGPSFTVTVAAPTVTNLSVSSGLVGSTVVITGTNLTNASAVSFGGITAPAFHVDSATQITVAVPAGALTGAVSVTTPGGAANGPVYTVKAPAPVITGLSVVSGVAGSTVVITGTNLANASNVSFNGVTAAMTGNTTGQITVTVPTGATTGYVTVTTPSGISTGVMFTVTVAAPTLTSINPTNAAMGDTVILTGTNFSSDAAVQFNGIPAMVLVNSSTKITAVVPTGATTGNVTVTTVAGTSTGLPFTVVTPAPTVTNLSPTSGAVGAVVVITGTNLLNASEVSFGGVAATNVHVDGPTQITATVPAGALTGVVKVTTPVGFVNGPSFTVTVPTLSLTSVSPASAAVGDTVILTGTKFTNGATVSFNGIAATSVTVNSPTMITVVVPAGATSGSVLVTTADGPSNGQAFTVTLPAPTLASLNPASGAVGSLVIITGSNFISGSTVTFGGTPATSVTVNSATQITATVPAGATSGAVSVTTPGGRANGQAFTVTTSSGVTYNAILNGDFELGTGLGWTVKYEAAIRVADIRSDPPYFPNGAHSGNWIGYCGGGEADERQFGQIIQIPAGATRADLHFWLAKNSASNDALDVFTVEAASLTAVPTAADPTKFTHAVLGTLFTTDGGSAPTDWTEHVVDLKAYAGQTVVLQFHGKPVDSTPGSVDRTAWSVDDVTLQVDAPVLASLPGTLTSSVDRGVMGVTPVILTGINVVGTTAVQFGGVATTNFTILDYQTLQVVVPPLALSGPITVVTPQGNAVTSTPFLVRNADLLINGDFEGFRTGWNASVCTPAQNMRVQSTVFGGTYPATPHSGTSFALIGQGTVADQRIAQDVTIPAGTTLAEFSFWLYSTGYLPAGNVSDTLTVTVEDLTGKVLNTVKSFNGTTLPLNAWTKYTVDLSAFAGQTVRIDFRALSVDGNYTNWYIDDASLQVNSALPSVQSVVTGFAFEGAPLTQLLEGSDLQIKGSNFYGITGILFNGVSAAPGSFKVLAPDTILVTIPMGAKSGPVTLQTGRGDVQSPSFTVLKQAAELVLNGDFESGLTSWPPDDRVADTTVGTWSLQPMKPSGGTHYGYLSSATTESNNLHQVISIPAACNQAILSYYQACDSNGSYNYMGFDILTVKVIDGANTQVLQSLDAMDYRTTTLWQKRNFDLSAYRGKTITLQFQGDFTGTNSGHADWTNFYVDNVSLRVDTTDATTLQPRFDSYSPASGFPRETQVTLMGSNFYGVKAVKFNGIATTFEVTGPNSVMATVPARSTSGFITVETSNGNLTHSTPFNVTYHAPIGLAMVPNYGPIGTPILITGQFIDNVTSVLVNGVPATITQNGTNQVTALVPAGAGTGPVVISNPTQSTTVGTFTLNTTPTTGQDLWMDHVVVSQATQNATQTTNLVKDRSCAVRVYLRSNVLGLKPIVRVTVMNGGVEAFRVDIPAPSAGTPNVISETETNVWTTVLPPQAIQPGMSILVKVDPDGALPELDRTNDTWPAGSTTGQTYTVVDTKPMRITFVPLLVTTGGKTYLGDVTAASVGTYTPMFHSIWPLPDALDTSVHATVTTSYVPDANYNNWYPVLDEMLALAAIEHATNRYYYGVIKPTFDSGGTGMAQLAKPVAMGHDWGADGSNATSTSTWSWRTGTMAHELGHSMSRPHSPCGWAGSPDMAYPYPNAIIGQMGVDPFATGKQLRTYDAFNYHDVMAYCGYTWIGDYVYQKVMDYRLGVGGADPTLQGPVASNPAPAGTMGTTTANAGHTGSISTSAVQDCLLVWGEITDGVLKLRPSYVIQAVPDAPNPSGTYQASLTGANGQTLGTLVFEPAQADHTHNLGFAQVVPLGNIAQKTQPSAFTQGAQVNVPAVSGVKIHRNGVVLAEQKGPSTLAASNAAAGVIGLEPIAVRMPNGFVRFIWDKAVHPGVMIRNEKGEVICFAENGEVLLKTDAAELDVQFSDGITSTGQKVTVH